ncbi:MAG: PEP-CTERM sorting domain-containing protein [Gemmataceae bacterium]|nr:PEP-CTERM sorting domain-containing protein [Gemmataceae bacterium]MDW8265025.1 PEP-CTERM sorting domain-containing protein [Gemmataceae bacterium]
MKNAGMKRLAAAVLLGLGLVAGGESARAAILPSFVVPTVPEGPNTRYLYSLYLSSGSRLQPGNFFTIYDFAGLTSDPISMPTHWSVTTQLLGVTPSKTNPVDDPAIMNLTFTYSGPTIEAPSGTVFLGIFSAVSIYSSSADADFASQTGTVEGGVEKNVYSTRVPAPREVPEPATLAMLGAGLPLLGARRFLRRRSATGR